MPSAKRVDGSPARGRTDLKSVMDRMGHARISTTQTYLLTLPDADTKNALRRIRGRKPQNADGATPASNEDS